MAERDRRGVAAAAQVALRDDPAFLRGLVQGAVQAILEAEMTAHVGAERDERAPGRSGHRHGSKPHAYHAGGDARAAGAPEPGGHLVGDDGDGQPLGRQLLEQDERAGLGLPLRDEHIGVDEVGHRLSRSTLALLRALRLQIAQQLVTVNAGEGLVQGTQPGDGSLGIVVGEDIAGWYRLGDEERVEAFTGIHNHRFAAHLRRL